MGVLDTIRTEVEPLDDAVAATGALLDQLAAKIEASAGNQAEAQALADEIRTNRENLVNLTLAHTPVDPNPGGGGNGGGGESPFQP